MFVESQLRKPGYLGQWWDASARRHPGRFKAMLVLFVVVLTLALLFYVSPPVVLYQAF